MLFAKAQTIAPMTTPATKSITVTAASDKPALLRPIPLLALMR
jgi:hypothetical protein